MIMLFVTVTKHQDCGKVDADVFHSEHQNDESLKRGWEMADKGRGGFIVRDGLLYHRIRKYR